MLEGDEYNAAFFDRGPKFLHYEPRHLFIGNIEYDHADLYPDLDAVLDAFRKVAAIVPAERHHRRQRATIRASLGVAEGAAGAARARLDSKISAPTSRPRDIAFRPEGTEFTLVEGGHADRAPHLAAARAMHNVRNALGAIALVRGLGLSPAEIARALPRFAGVRRRLEVKGEKNGIVVVDDFAHHPTAVRGTLEAARARWPGRRLWALFEPRSNTAGRKIFEEDYAAAFAGADGLVIAPVFHSSRLPPEARIDREALVAAIPRRRKARLRAGEDRGDPGRSSRREARAGDVLLLMSSGAFGGLPETLLEGLSSRITPPPRDS